MRNFAFCRDHYFYIHIIKFTHEDDVCGHLLSALFTVDSNSFKFYLCVSARVV